MSSLTKLDGPRVEPASGERAKQLIVFAHGYGSNGEDLIGLAPYWQGLLPDAAFVSPNAPQICPGAPGGYQWWDIATARGDRLAGVRTAAPVLDAFIDSQLAHYGLADDKLVLIGFSQGTMMALHVALRRPQPLAAVVGYSGIYVTPESADGPDKARAEIRSKPPVLLVHGAQDDLIPAQALFLSANLLAAAEVPVQWHLSPGVAHGIDGEGLRQGGEFLASAFSKVT